MGAGVDLKEGFAIRLGQRTPRQLKDDLGLLQPGIDGDVQGYAQGLPLTPVFTYKGNSMAEMKRSFTTACQRAGIEGFHPFTI